MIETGRIKSTLRPEVAAIVFGETSDAAIDAEIEHYAHVDLAHVLGLGTARVIARDVAQALLREILDLRRDRFQPLRGRPAPRGLYLLYESHLIATLGPAVGGWLQLGRSRNDLSATVTKLRLRAPTTDVLEAAATLVRTLCGLAESWATTVMPAYTHHQPAVPVTYGHYCSGVAQAVLRDWESLRVACKGLESCPLGACAVGGTSIPIPTERCARWLGFEEGVTNSIDAVASRDYILRILAALSVLGVTLSRVAADFLRWSTQEFGFLLLPDHVVGSSSIMPQKRNPYLLEHVQGRAMIAFGGFCTAVAAMSKAPFSNSVVVGNEAVRVVWDGLRHAREALFLLTEVLSAAEPQPATMLDRAEHGFTSATHLAESLALRGVPFREAHHRVGELVSHAVRTVRSLSAVADRALEGLGVRGALSTEQACRASSHGGGPSSENVARVVTRVRERAGELELEQREDERRWADAAAELATLLDEYLKG